jgi:ribosomal protein S18 acetylase RimI-like enzyme
MNELIQGRQTLSGSDLEAIRELAEVCNKNDGIKLKLNWDLLISRQPGNTNDFLHFDDSGKLLGYIAIYNFGMPEAEISGMIHPSCRRNGIFSKLLAYAALECRKRSVKSLLFINDRNSLSGAAFAKSACSAFDHSEHRMELPGSMKPIDVKYPIELRKATASDMDMLTKLNSICFGMNEDESRSYMMEMVTGALEIYVSVLGGKNIGMLRLNWENDDLMIYGFGVLPEFRGKGYGRATLAAAVNLSLSRKPAHVGLEVDCVNDTALSLYKSCGFNTIATYDYYRLAL